jgi:uncharacterized protein YfaS (alpha-2-macroglobulin family)
MKKSLASALGVFLAVLLLCAPCFAQSGTKKLWENVYEAQKKGLPKTAIDNLKLICKAALNEKREGEAMKALCLQIVLEANIKGNKPEFKVQRLKEELKTADPRLKPIMNTLLAQWYWHYYSRNKWRFLNRTATSGLAEDDFTTWDLPKLFNEIASIFDALLKDEQSLKAAKITEFADVLEKGNVPPSLRPTLFDFIAYKALEFYTSGEQAAALPEDAFQIDVSSGALDEAEKFLRLSPNTTDTGSPKYKAFKIYQKIMLFHQNDSDKDAFVDADCARINYMYNMAIGEGKEGLYIKRMKEIVTKYPASTLSSLASYYWAQKVYDRGNLVEAYAIASSGKKMHPESYGAKKCASLIASITAKSMELKGERVLPSHKKSGMLLTYRNIDTVTFRVVKDNWKDYMRTDCYSFNPGEKDIDRLLKQAPAAQWTVQLKPTDDYRARKVMVDMPELPTGFYRIFASYRKDFTRPGNCLEHSMVWISDISLITRLQNENISGLVVETLSGNPVKNATVTLYGLKDYNHKNYEVVSSAKSDDNGCYSFGDIKQGSFYQLRVHAKDEKGSEFLDAADLYVYHRYPEERRMHTVFYTDRAIYRPGQMVQFKTLVLDVDKEGNNYRVVPGQKISVYFKDANYQEVSRMELTTNDFGSASGTFNAPTDRLTGAMTVGCDSPQGAGSFRVEEYKRPKFIVNLSLPKESFRLNEEVSLTGEAQSYAGAPVDGAKVSYRIVREVRMPYWWGFFFRRGAVIFRGSRSQEISHGTAKTDTSGKFTISFKALPDEQIPRSDEPTFIYQIFADVTDSAGETRSDEKSVRIGYASMEAFMNADKWQVEGKHAKIAVSTTTLDGTPVKAEGVVEIYALKQPAAPRRAAIMEDPDLSSDESADESSGNDSARGTVSSADPRTWPLGPLVTKSSFATVGEKPCDLNFTLKAGAYRAMLTTKDKFGSTVTALLPLMVFDEKAQKFAIRIPSCYVAKSATLEVGETFRALWGTGYESGRAFIEIFQNGRALKRYWTDPQKTQCLIEYPVAEQLRGGFTVIATSVRENRLYSSRTDVSVPWSNKRLDVTLETFRSKLQPGADETWTLRVKGPGAEKKAAELVATLYDESLDAFAPHSWGTLDHFFRYNSTSFQERFSNVSQAFSCWYADWGSGIYVGERIYANFLNELVANFYGYEYSKSKKEAMPSGAMDKVAGKPDATTAAEPMAQNAPAPPPAEARKAAPRNGGKDEESSIGGLAGDAQHKQGAPPKDDLSSVKARKNLNETAFFFPHLLTDKDGTVKLTFKMPEALTKWHLLALAHGSLMESGIASGHTVTQKDLMVQPNPPRFLREGDELEFTVKVTNMADVEAKGNLRLTFTDPATEKSIDGQLKNTTTDRDISIPAKQSRSFAWRLIVPDNLTMVSYKAVAAANNLKDGEEGILPVLSRRIYVQESIPLWVRGPGERRFTFEKLKSSGASKTLVNKNFTVQVASNPSWYAVQALPFLMEFPHECSEQVFNRLYANALARQIATSDPKIRKVFDTWRESQPDALLSNLEKNEQLKSVALLETPWVLQAKSETQAKHNVGILFEDVRMKRELESAFAKLKNMQLNDGSWPWFPGGRGNSFITLYIATGFGRLKHLNTAGVPQECALKAMDHLDAWINEVYRNILKHRLQKENNLNSTVALYLYGRSFYLKEKPIPAHAREAVDYFLGQARQYWLKLDCRMSQGHLALALFRFGDLKTAHDIMASIKERSQTSEELGMFWGETELSWWWYRAPIETQALMIEAFDEVMNDQKAAEECKVWLLKQKQTQDWKTTKATADSVYALLCRGDNLLASDALVEVTLGSLKVQPDKVEAGTGFYEKCFDGPDVQPSFGDITMKKPDKGIAWGGAHWAYMEDIGKVTAHRQGPLTLHKSVFVQRNTKSGPVIEPVKQEGGTPLEVGDLLKVRIELRTDRDMEYAHMRDGRGSGLEPVNVLSQYKYQDGLWYYEATKDTATHFYIDYLPKGTYVFEYPLRVVHKGKYQNDMAHIECMYAPEFNSHSESVTLEVK